MQKQHLKTLTTLALASCLSGYSLSGMTGTPVLYLDQATISGAADTVTFTRVPAQDAAGNITYSDVTKRARIFRES